MVVNVLNEDDVFALSLMPIWWPGPVQSAIGVTVREGDDGSRREGLP